MVCVFPLMVSGKDSESYLFPINSEIKAKSSPFTTNTGRRLGFRRSNGRKPCRRVQEDGHCIWRKTKGFVWFTQALRALMVKI